MSINLKDLKKFPGNKDLGGDFMLLPVDTRKYSVKDIPKLQPNRVQVRAIIPQSVGRPLRPFLCLVSDLPDNDQFGVIHGKRNVKILELDNKIDGADITINPGERTFSSLCNKYRVERLSKFKDSWTPSQQLKRWESELGDLTLEEIKPADVAAAKKKLLNGRSPKTINNYLWAISGCFDHGIKRLHWISYNPVKEVEREEVNNEIDRYMTDEERKRFFEGLL